MSDRLRPVYGGSRKFQDDPHWRDLILFYEYFHGGNGAGLGASHQTGWPGSSGNRWEDRRRAASEEADVSGARYPALDQVNTRDWLTEPPQA